ncbi:30S ribosomal protein S12 [Klebsiella pneumoniae]|uniref:30S ribosomal protein S12 n=1 Tax=Klebsiella pneumoniae TaxID=573 RepID=A0A377V9A1_KLEPN|nr:30S ribosomal protein S12 [Klebsiella pneumoniae]
MATINQLVRKPRARKVAKSNVPALEACRRNVAYVLAYIPPL